MTSFRMLFFVGAGPAAIHRVDIAQLFGKDLRDLGLQVQWYVRVGELGGPVDRTSFCDAPAFACGRSKMPGIAGRVISKLQEWFATLHFFGTALRMDCQIIQVRDDFLGGLLGLAAARLRRRRFVFWLSYPFPESRLADAKEGRARWPGYSRLVGHASAWALYRWILPYADHTFVQSEQMKRDVVRPGIEGDRITAVPMGIPDDDLPTRMDPSIEPVVLYLGTLARVRRLEMIVDAFEYVHRRVPDAKLLIVGDGDSPEDRDVLVRAARARQLQHCIEFTGRVSRVQALGWIAKSAVCLSPFFPTFVLRSTSPTKLIEYMAFGRAVVANDHPEQAEVLAASGAGLCTAWDPRSFGEAIVTLLEDSSRRNSAGEAGRRWVEANRRYSVIARRLSDEYGRILATTNKR